jgi:DNA-binding MarR family transcriptional regulator
MNYDNLKLSNQLCFPIYATSRLVIRQYQPFLDKIGITYPQYLVLMVLWEEDEQFVTDIASKLILNTNTITPLLKRMEQQQLIIRKKSSADERKIMVKLTNKGLNLRKEATCIPENLIKNINSEEINIEELIKLKASLNKLIELLK